MLILFFSCLIICIILHELSHLLVAKAVGCSIEVISLGFGKPIVFFEYKDIRINISPILLGGYCKLKGELEYSEDNDAFLNLTLRRKIAITIAGIAINIITGAIALLMAYKTYNLFLMVFGGISVLCGLCNLIPTFPCLDGSYLIYYPLILKKFGKVEGIKIIKYIVDISFRIAIIINILSIPILFLMIKK